ncbi:MAG: hypothetical protein C4581_13885 [Nitrospiraceae bacterium]|nr:MAG: hypothetical protein C4581_13885 [Nitrospiraceae bacterium]
MINTQLSRAYVNDFLFFVIRHDDNSSNGNVICCSGINVDRFTPITKGRHNPMSNPAIRGLQLIQYDIMALALQHGTSAKPFHGYRDSELPPTGEVWSMECLLIKNVPPSLPDRIINHAVIELLKKIDRAGMLGASLPDKLLGPDELQMFIESMCTKYAIKAA